MEKKQFGRINVIVASVVFVLSAIVYLSTLEPTASFWDCGEFIASSFKLEVGHPPGNPSFNLFARIFTIFADEQHAALAVNAMSGICSALTIFFLYLSIVHFGRRLLENKGRKLTKANTVALLGAGVVGSMAYCFSDTFWFSAVEGEVYAMSSLFTAVVFWAGLKWEEQADEPYANRWLILICFLMGISVGVHLLNLLTIPAIVFIYYYKRHTKPVTFWRCFGVLCLSGIILAVILFGIIPYLPRMAAGFDRFFVNSLGAKFNVGAAFFMVLLFALSFWGLSALRKKNKAVAHTFLLCFTTIVIGYSLFTITIIRSCAGTPTNEYQPDNPYTLIRYLGREQYGSNPIVFGETFNSPYEVEETDYYTPLDGKYHKASNVEATYPASAKMFFPRMWNGLSNNYVEFYKNYCEDYNTKSVRVNGQNKNVQMPKFKDNLRFFIDYQVNYMYLRYFMWNFVGRQNDFHGQTPGDLVSGNWESGIKFIDTIRLGDQSTGPDVLVNNRSKNHYYFLPLILGLIGFFFQLRRDQRGCWVTGLLFLLTGLAIVVYLNQPPFQVRERDYAYAGSFYVFALWIGLGVLALQEWIENLTKKESLPGAAAAVALSMVIPVLMGCENWDDHDRSGRYTARDLAYNYLQSTDPNAILVTHGDNDTFPLWYAQEVEGIRTDVRIVNTSLLGTDWYIDQMKQTFYDSKPLDISIERKQYLYGTNDFVPVVEAVDYPILASDAIGVFRNPKFVTTTGDDYIPAKTLIIPVNKENVKKYGIVSEKYYDRIEDNIQITISASHLTKSDLIILDLLANYDWSRPIYFISRGETELGLDRWLDDSGFAHKLVPIVAGSGEEDGIVDSEKMYDKIMNVYRFDSLRDTTVHFDYQNIYTFSAVVPIREMFVTASDALIKDNRLLEAKLVLDKAVESLPSRNIPYNVSLLRGFNEWAVLGIIENYLRLGRNEEAKKVADTMADETIATILFHSTPTGPGEDDVLNKKLADDGATMYYYLIRLFSSFGQDDYAKALQAKLNDY